MEAWLAALSIDADTSNGGDGSLLREIDLSIAESDAENRATDTFSVELDV
ncbi:MAG: hypothetical protein QM715_04415 [Nibricoccus sp.]